ncbi:MAG: GAF and ANTAR domain-containing protein, partial [Pseudonocardia sediminis]
TTVAATDDVPVRVDAIQYELGEGPCVGAMTDHEIYLIDDLATEPRWPRFSRRAAAETGVASMLSFRLFLEEDTIGALNLFSRTVAAFTAHDRDVGAVLAAHAAVAMAAARQRERAEQLDTALATSRRIGIAMGVLMARRSVTEQRAFDLLREESQHRNTKLRDVAEAVVATGELPTP